MKVHSKVTVGMPVLNGEEFIRRALDAILAQDYPNIDIIISENASIDKTKEICLEYESLNDNITLIQQQDKISAIDNFSEVLKASSGQYFMWAAADDSWYPSFVSRLVAELEKDKNVAVAQSSTKKVDSNGDCIGYLGFSGNKNLQGLSSIRLVRKILSFTKYNFYIYGLFRRELLVEAFSFMPTIPSSDRWFLLQFALAGYVFSYVDEPLYVRTVHEKPLYERYENDGLAEQVKKNNEVMFNFESLSAVKKMLDESTMIKGLPKFMCFYTMMSLFFFRVRVGVYLMIKKILVTFSPKRLILAILDFKRKR
jgi:glycosyltransferase involved in cell wall biosynthesis